MTCNMPAGDRAMPDDPEKIYSNTLVTISLKGELHQLGPDLEQKELAAIGWVTAHWASRCVRTQSQMFQNRKRKFPKAADQKVSREHG
jgi:hypothetical protein